MPMFCKAMLAISNQLLRSRIKKRPTHTHKYTHTLAPNKQINDALPFLNQF